MKMQGMVQKIDIPTLVVISALAWILVNVSHEILGHAGAAALLGIPVSAVSTTNASILGDYITSIGTFRTIMAAGTVLNLIGGVAALMVLIVKKQAQSAARYFLWLFCTFSFIIASMNLVSGSLLGGGDWAVFSRELEPAGLWKAIILGTGVIVTVLGYALPLRSWMPVLKNSRRALLTVTLVPVIIVIAVQSLSLISSPSIKLPPASNPLLASVFAYFHFILWSILVNILPVPRSKKSAQSIELPRSYLWLVLGLIGTLFYVVVLGPGIGSG